MKKLGYYRNHCGICRSTGRKASFGLEIREGERHAMKRSGRTSRQPWSSIVHWMVMCARGEFALSLYFVMAMVYLLPWQQVRGRQARGTCADDENFGVEGVHGALGFVVLCV
jgi:hypothetical protein